MKTITVRNVHDALPHGLRLLKEIGVRRDSRNGPVVMSPVPVATVYQRPWERVLFWAERDANPFFHLYESLWMLAGRNDIAPLVRYVKRMQDFSDDGVTQHGAYGYRWRKQFGIGIDQIQIIVNRLRLNKDDRRCVLQMWSIVADLGRNGRDVPCNTTITFQIDCDGKLQMVVFCRSNDVILGAYGANAVHMSVLQEYVARAVGVEIGTYTQVSVNYHAYEETARDLWVLADAAPSGYAGDQSLRYVNPYDASGKVIFPLSIGADDISIGAVLTAADKGYVVDGPDVLPWARVISYVLHAHRLYKQLSGEDRYGVPIELLGKIERETMSYDWIVAAREWIQRRYDRFRKKEA